MTETIKKKPDNKPDFSELDAESSLQDRQIMQLQTQLAEEKDLRKEERFCLWFHYSNYLQYHAFQCDWWY